MVLTVDWLSDQGNGDTLDLGRLDEAELLNDTSNEFRRDGKLILGAIPRLLLVDEGTHDVPRMPVLNQLSISSIVVIYQFSVFGRDRSRRLLLLFLLLFTRGCSLSSRSLL